MDFAEKELIWKAYTTAKTLFTTKKIQIIDPKEFAKAVLDLEQMAFVVHITTLFVKPMKVYLDCKVQIAVLIADKAPVIVPAEYLDFADVIFKKSAVVLLEHIEINSHAINLDEGKKTLYEPIYSLGLVELEILKTYIKTNLANSFIRFFKSLASALILFARKLNESFWLCVDYRGVNNITIKNRYPLLLIDKSLNYLGHDNQFR